MRENKEIKVRYRFIIIVLLLCIGGLCWYIYSIKNIDTMNNSNTVAENNLVDNTINNNENDLATVDKIDNTKDWVYTDSTTESFGGGTAYIPLVNIDSSDAKEINEKIKKIYTLNLNILYEFYINSDILSIVLIGSGNSWDYSEAYNIDIYTGKAIDNAQLLQYKNIAAQDLLNKLPKIYSKQLVEWKGTLEEYVEENTRGDDSPSAAKEWYQTLQKVNVEAINDFDINTNYMYLDANFNLNLIIEIEYPEGSKGLDSYIVGTRM